MTNEAKDEATDYQADVGEEDGDQEQEWTQNDDQDTEYVSHETQTDTTTAAGVIALENAEAPDDPDGRLTLVNRIIGEVGSIDLLVRFRRYAVVREDLKSLGFPVWLGRRRNRRAVIDYPYYRFYPGNVHFISQENQRVYIEPNIYALRQYYCLKTHFEYLPYNIPGYIEACFPMPCPNFAIHEYPIDQFNWRMTYHRNAISPTCLRCGVVFHINEATGEYITTDKCYYHWGKLKWHPIENRTRTGPAFMKLYQCCYAEENGPGCSKGELHVWNGIIPGTPYNRLHNFKGTKPRVIKNNSNFKIEDIILGLDCEMFYTVKGLDVCKVTIVNLYGKVVYNTLVKANANVVDYNTRFSGVDKDDFVKNRKRLSIKSLEEVQNDLLKLIYEDTILVGHSLENDLRVLNIVHEQVVDTSLVFPHPSGFPYRRSLKSLASEYLKREIQNNNDGHCSHEDARACIDLMLWKVMDDLKIAL